MLTKTGSNNRWTRFRFTKSTLQAALEKFFADSDKSQVDCYDTKCTGLIAVFYRSGRVNFRARVIVHGRRLSLGLGNHGPQFTVEQARLACSAARLQAAHGIDPRAPSPVEITFDHVWFDHYYPTFKTRKRSIEGDAQKVVLRLSPEFGRMPLAAITSSMIVAFLDRMRDNEHLSPATVNRYLALLKAIFRYAIRNDFCSKSPADYIRALPELNIRTRALDPAECQRFTSACEREKNRQAALLLLLLLLTAARLGEALAAKVEDIDFESGVWYLPITKSGKPSQIHLSSPAVQLLRKIMGARRVGYLFPGKESSKPMTRPTKAFRRICADANIVSFRIHDLRRTWASIAVNAGVPLFTVSKALRHSTPNITAARYAHLQDQTLLDAHNLVGKLISPV